VDNNTITSHLIKISEDIGSIGTKIDNVADLVKQHTDKDDEVHEDHAQRITQLEDQHKKVKWIAVGAGFVLGGLWKVVEFVVSTVGTAQ
jgi:ABC-type hemin transport system substrate-binding protein